MSSNALLSNFTLQVYAGIFSFVFVFFCPGLYSLISKESSMK